MAKNRGMVKGAASAPALVSKTVRLVFARDTKPGEQGGAAVYSEVDAKGKVIDTKNRDAGGLDQALIGSLYLRKKLLGGTPEAVTVTVAVGK